MSVRPSDLVVVCALVSLSTLADDQQERASRDSDASAHGPAVSPGWHSAGIPLVSYGSDVGLTLGAALFLYRGVGYRELQPDMQQTSTLSFSWASRGPHRLDLRGTPHLTGAIEGRVNLHLSDDPQMPYWGEGAQLGGLGVPAGYGTPPPSMRIMTAGRSWRPSCAGQSTHPWDGTSAADTSTSACP